MYLRDVMVLPAESSNEANVRLRLSSNHVLDIFRYYLPQKYDLMGLRRVVVELGRTETPVRDTYRGGLGVGYYSVPAFELDRYFSLPPKEQEEEMLQCVDQGLVNLALRFGTDPTPLRFAAQQVKHTHFRLVVELKCSKVHPSRKLWVKVMRTFAPGGVFVRCEVWNKEGDLLLSKELMSAAWIVTVQNNFHSSRWNANTLELCDRLGKATAEIPCHAYLEP